MKKIAFVLIVSLLSILSTSAFASSILSDPKTSILSPKAPMTPPTLSSNPEELSTPEFLFPHTLSSRTLTLILLSPKHAYMDVSILSPSGEVVHTSSHAIFEVENLEIPIENLDAGSYLVECTIGLELYSFPLQTF